MKKLARRAIGGERYAQAATIVGGLSAQVRRWKHLRPRVQIFDEIAIKLIGIDTTILGSILKPFVSSSKNLIRPPLDAGSGADLSAIMIQTNEFYHKNFLIFL